MAKQILTSLDLLALPNLTTPRTGSVGFGAKSDGLYQKMGAVETRLSVDGHSHPIANVTGLQNALNSKLETSIFNTHNNDNVRHITGAERTKWDGVVTDFAGLEIGGRNLALNSSEPLYRSTSNRKRVKISLPSFLTYSSDFATVSFQVRNAEQQFQGYFYDHIVRYEDSNSSFSPNSINSDKWETVKTIIDLSRIKNVEDLQDLSFTIRYSPDFNDPINADIRNVMVSFGTKATDWTPAPEDQVSDWNTTDTNSFSFIKNKPTTLLGYGITDAYTKTNVNDLLSNKSDKVTKITAGNGLTGGGTLAADRTITLGKPSTLTASTTNEVTASSHTHAITTTSVGAANTIIQTDASGGTKLGNLTIGDWSLLTEYSGTYFTIKYGGENKMRISTVGSGAVEFNNNLFTDGNITAEGSILAYDDVTAHELIAYETVTTPKVIFAAAGWSMIQVGSELQMQFNGVVKQRYTNTGDIIATGEVTAFY